MSVREDFKKWLEAQPEQRVEKVYRIALTLQHVEDNDKQGYMSSVDKGWLDAGAEDLAKGIAAAEADTPPDELQDWLTAMENAVKPLEARHDAKR